MIPLHTNFLLNQTNAGKIKNADKIIETKSTSCGDSIKMYFKISNNVITDVKYEVFGCWAVITSCSIMSEYIKNKEINEIKNLTESDYEKIFELIPDANRNCFLLIDEILKKL